MIKIIAIKTDTDYLISDNTENKGYYSSYLHNLFFDGVKPEKTFKSDWFKIKNKPVKIEREVISPSINKRFELKSEFDKGVFKKVWLYSEAYDEDSEIVDEFKDIRVLYDYKEDKQPNTLESIEFEWKTLLEIEVYTEPQGFSYKTIGKWHNDVSPSVTQSNLEYNILSQVLTPSILLHTQPCKLSSKATYDIIRAFIKENINPRVAEIKSDYDFCFSVHKKISIAKPYTYQIDVNSSIFGGRKKKPKYETRLVDKKSIQIFEMTHNQAGGNGRGYDKYTLVTPFEAENQEALKKYIDAYLEHLINVINEPLCECDKCNGTGVLFDQEIEKI
ncbi:MAG TPA: hypothetical protein PKD00_00095 [Burkholderiales bacterium]|nr:hypothetical protein [Burkholderiales bacterium]